MPGKLGATKFEPISSSNAGGYDADDFFDDDVDMWQDDTDDLDDLLESGDLDDRYGVGRSSNGSNNNHGYQNGSLGQYRTVGRGGGERSTGFHEEQSASKKKRLLRFLVLFILVCALISLPMSKEDNYDSGDDNMNGLSRNDVDDDAVANPSNNSIQIDGDDDDTYGGQKGATHNKTPSPTRAPTKLPTKLPTKTTTTTTTTTSPPTSTPTFSPTVAATEKKAMDDNNDNDDDTTTNNDKNKHENDGDDQIDNELKDTASPTSSPTPKKTTDSPTVRSTTFTPTIQKTLSPTKSIIATTAEPTSKSSEKVTDKQEEGDKQNVNGKGHGHNDDLCDDDNDQEFKINRKKKTCAYLTSDPTNIRFCSWPNVNTICTKTCGLCDANGDLGDLTMDDDTSNNADSTDTGDNDGGDAGDNKQEETTIGLTPSPTTKATTLSPSASPTQTKTPSPTSIPIPKQESTGKDDNAECKDKEGKFTIKNHEIDCAWIGQLKNLKYCAKEIVNTHCMTTCGLCDEDDNLMDDDLPDEHHNMMIL